jgi:hypothetical protein
LSRRRGQAGANSQRGSSLVDRAPGAHRSRDHERRRIQVGPKRCVWGWTVPKETPVRRPANKRSECTGDLRNDPERKPISGVAGFFMSLATRPTSGPQAPKRPQIAQRNLVDGLSDLEYYSVEHNLKCQKRRMARHASNYWLNKGGRHDGR